MNGNIVGYNVTYQTSFRGGMESVFVPGTWNMDGHQVTLNELTPFTTYSIQVAAVNNQSDVGVFSAPETGQTNEDGKKKYQFCVQ